MVEPKDLLFCMRNKETGVVIEIFADNVKEAKERLAKVMDLHESNVDKHYDVSFATENHKNPPPGEGTQA